MKNAAKEYHEENSKYLKLKDGETFCGVFLSCKKAPNRFEPGKQTVEYTFQNEEGREVSFENGSLGVSDFFGDLPDGSEFSMTRDGEGSKTRYILKRA
jgi:hypothetical protein